MEGNPHRSASEPIPGGLIQLQARLADLTTWLGPAWAALCGVVASGDFGGHGEDWLRLTLLILLVDGGWGTLWAALGGTDWAAPLRQWRTWESGERMPKPPYTLPGSPGDQALRWAGQFRAWWRRLFWLDCGPALLAIVVALAITILLGVLLGVELLLLSAAAVAVMQLGLTWAGGRGTVAPGWNAIIALTLPWLAGHIAFGSLTPHSAWLALAYALAWGSAWRAESPWGRMLGVGGQFLAAVFLIAVHRPLAAGGLLLLVPQLVLLTWLQRGQPASWYVRHTRPWLMAAMLIAAWAL